MTTEEKNYTLAQANQHFAVSYNNQIWTLAALEHRSHEDLEKMIHLAHASFLHWSESPNCTNANLQRGYFMLALAYTYAQNPSEALWYAQQCLEITQKFPTEMEDFDVAYSYLAMARALAISDKRGESMQYLMRARTSGEAIQDEEDKKIFLNDFKADIR